MSVFVLVVMIIVGIVSYMTRENFTHKKYGALVKDLPSIPNIVIPVTFNDTKPYPAYTHGFRSLITKAIDVTRATVMGAPTTTPQPVASLKDGSVASPQTATVPTASTQSTNEVSVTPQPTDVVASEPVSVKATTQPVAAAAEVVDVTATTIQPAVVAAEPVAVKATTQPVAVAAAEPVSVKATAQPVAAAAEPVAVEVTTQPVTVAVEPAEDACYARVAQGCVNKPNTDGGLWQSGQWELHPSARAQVSSSKCKQR